MPALALSQSNQIVGQEADKQRSQEVPGFVFVRRDQEDRRGPLDKLFGIQIVVVGADQLFQFCIHEFQQFGQRRRNDIEGGSNIRACGSADIAFNSPVGNPLQHGSQAAFLDGVPFLRVICPCQFDNQIKNTDDVALAVMAVLRYQEDQAGYQTTGSLVKILAAVTTVHRAGIADNRAGYDLGVAFCRGIMHGPLLGVLLLAPCVDLDVDAVQKIKMTRVEYVPQIELQHAVAALFQFGAGNRIQVILDRYQNHAGPLADSLGVLRVQIYPGVVGDRGDIQAGGLTGTRRGDHQYRLIACIDQPGAFGCTHEHGRLRLMSLLHFLINPLDFLRLHEVGVAVLAVPGFYIPDSQGLTVEQFNDSRGQYGQ